jgi:hypothetical protein
MIKGLLSRFRLGKAKGRIKTVLGITILALTTLSLIFSIKIHRASDQMGATELHALVAQDLLTRWGAKNDIVRTLRSFETTGFFSVAPDTLQQDYEYYLKAKYFLNTEEFPPQSAVDTATAKIRNFSDFDTSLKDQQLTFNSLNNRVISYSNDFGFLKSTEENYFMWLTIDQIIVALLGFLVAVL